MTLFIHIGFGKTGTTAIQDFFFHHRDDLAKASLIYPQTGLRGTGHHDLAELGLRELRPIVKSHWRTIAQQLKEKPNQSVLLSSENFCFMHPDCIREMSELFEGQRVKILFYIRPQVPLVESTYLHWQVTNLDYRGEIGRFFFWHHEAFDFEARIAPWVENFGEEAILARLYDKRITGEDVRADLLELLGMRGVIEVGDLEKSNTSLLPEYSNLVALIDELSPIAKSRQAIIEELLQLSRRSKKTPGFSLIDDELKRGITELYAASNRRFAERFLDEQQSAIILLSL